MIARDVVLRVPPDRAFEAFTDMVHLWWPRGHHISGDPDGVVQFEARPGGRFYERASDGREVEYGQVVHWDPPGGLSYRFFPGSSRALPTLVQVSFVPVGEGTRVEIRHRVGDMPQSDFDRTAVRFERSWAACAEGLTALFTGDPS